MTRPVMRQILAWLLPDVFDGSNQVSRRYYFRLSKARGHGSNIILSSALADQPSYCKRLHHPLSGNHQNQTQLHQSLNGKMTTTMTSSKGRAESSSCSQAVIADDADAAAGRATDYEGEMEGGEESTYLPPDAARMRFDSFDVGDPKYLGKGDDAV